MTEYRIHRPHTARVHHAWRRHISTPQPVLSYAPGERFEGSLAELIAQARPQIERARQIGLLSFAPVKDSEPGDELDSPSSR